MEEGSGGGGGACAAAAAGAASAEAAGGAAEAKSELAMLQSCASPYILAWRAALRHDGALWLVTELCEGGSLLDVIKSRGAPLLEVQVAAAMGGALEVRRRAARRARAAAPASHRPTARRRPARLLPESALPRTSGRRGCATFTRGGCCTATSKRPTCSSTRSAT